MLVLSRRTDQTIVLGSNIVLTVVAVKGNRVKIGIEAPADVRVLRGELPVLSDERVLSDELDECASLPIDAVSQDMVSNSVAMIAPR